VPRIDAFIENRSAAFVFRNWYPVRTSSGSHSDFVEAFSGRHFLVLPAFKVGLRQ
jgi:hypothetical protein